MKFNVSRKNIRYGRRGDGSSCAVALACKKNGLQDIDVSGATVSGTYNGKEVFFTLPKFVQRFIELFDDEVTTPNKTRLKPFSFTRALKHETDF